MEPGGSGWSQEVVGGARRKWVEPDVADAVDWDILYCLHITSAARLNLWTPV